MELDAEFMGSVISMYDVLTNNGISLVYIGKFNHQVTKMFTGLYEQEMETFDEDKKMKKRVYHILVEILQNMQKHSNQMSENFLLGSGLFMVGKIEDTYYIITANKIEKRNIPELVQAIEQVNACTKDELRILHKKQLKDGKITKKGGAGLGLIEIARKTGEKIEYMFLPYNNTDNYFVLKVEISSKSISEEDE